MWFEKGDPSAPVLTNWEHPWRKHGGDNPTTIYLSAPVSPDLQYRLRGPIGDAVYAGVQVYTRGPGFNAPSANISDTDLLGGGREIDLLIGGRGPDDGTPWLPLVADDYLVMVRLYHDSSPVALPPLSLSCIDAAGGIGLLWSERATNAVTFFREAVLSTTSVTEVLRAAGVNRYPPPGAPVKAPRYTGALFPRSTMSTTGSTSASAPGRRCVCGARHPPRGSGPWCSTTAGSTPQTSLPTDASSPEPTSNSTLTATTRSSWALAIPDTPTGSNGRPHRRNLRHPLSASAAARTARRRGDQSRMTAARWRDDGTASFKLARRELCR